ncbi:MULTISPECIES: hypothetical protein [Chelativorans]|jgi:hypothetical protein|uniref:Uncharacterized protein n=1 Tax=Chelativorans sp. (strain BNC1) TaxID=266779 RepID=Q11IY9_CHESB|nr:MULTISPECIES: hypothetical protein [Chelativorans]
MWQRIRDFFRDSETLAWARLQMILGVLLEVITTVDPYLFAPVFGDYFPWFLVANGLITEYLRRRRADDLKPRHREPDYSGAS